MRNFWLSTLLLLTMLPFMHSSVQAETPTADPAGVVTAIFEALVTGDVDAALALTAEDAVLTLSGPPPGVEPALVGKEAIRSWWETFASWNPEIEIIDITTQGDMVMMTSYITEDGFRSMAVAPMRSETVAIVQDGLLRAYTVTFSKESQAKLAAALERESKKVIVARFYDEIWNEGNITTADELIAPDFVDGFSGQTGIQPLKDTVQLFRTAFPDMQITYGDMVVEDDLIVVTITNTMGTYQGGLPDFFGIPESAIGSDVVLHGIDYARVVDGQIVAGWGVHDDLGWLRQFGLELTPTK